MGIISSHEQKWIKSKRSSPWNQAFSSFAEYDAMLTKLMVWECVSFADELLSTAFRTENRTIRVDTILLAKMHFYHLVTKSPTVHSLFYGYLFELYTNHYHEDIETANLTISQMRNREKWYLTWYYDYYNRENGEFKDVLRAYCNDAASNKTPDGLPVLDASKDHLQYEAARALTKMHQSFLIQCGALQK
jgi:hypothetical protein